jgi:hypothetical protein
MTRKPLLGVLAWGTLAALLLAAGPELRTWLGYLGGMVAIVAIIYSLPFGRQTVDACQSTPTALCSIRSSARGAAKTSAWTRRHNVDDLQRRHEEGLQYSGQPLGRDAIT